MGGGGEDKFLTGGGQKSGMEPITLQNSEIEKNFFENRNSEAK